MSVGLTVRAEPGAPARAALRVRLVCARAGGPVVDWAWDTEWLPRGRDGATLAGESIARMVARMRRLGCRCRLDLSDLSTVTQALSLVLRSG